MSLGGEVCRANLTLLAFMVDMSGSTADRTIYQEKEMRKSEAISQIINTFIYDAINSCNFGNEYRDYMHFIVLGYNGHGVKSLLEPYIKSGKFYATAKELVEANAPLIVHNVFNESTKPVTIRYYDLIKIEPYHITPMCEAMRDLYSLIGKWINEKGANSSNVIATNLTDGETTDGSTAELLNTATRIKNIQCPNGELLFTNIHMGNNDKEEAIMFPHSEAQLKNSRFGETLFNMSSYLPEDISRDIAEQTGVDWHEGARIKAVSFNTSMSKILSVLQIGSKSFI